MTKSVFFPAIAAIALVAPSLRAEVPPRDSIPCFPGAYYRKAVSSFDHWQGIEGIVRLPTPAFDEGRVNTTTTRYLDNPSIYIGGRSETNEIDAGLTWEVIREPDGKVSKRGKAFRPFWRNEKWFSGPAKPEYYFNPGDRVYMKCGTTTEPGKLTLTIALLSRADGNETETRRTNPRDAISSLTVAFDAPSFGPAALQEFKRVNAIDQSGNEGKGVAETSASVTGARWEEVWLLRDEGRLPFTARRFTDMRCPAAAHFVVEQGPHLDNGGEVISIFGNPDSIPKDSKP